MLPIPRRKHSSKGRKYPIRKDDEGRSLRQRAFHEFDKGLRPAQVARELGAKPATMYHYHHDWKKSDQPLPVMYRILRIALKHPNARRRLAERLARHFDVPVADVLERLQKPWAAKQLATGEWRSWMPDAEQKRNWARLKAAGRIVELYVKLGVAPDRIFGELERLRAEVRLERAKQEAAERDETGSA